MRHNRLCDIVPAGKASLAMVVVFLFGCVSETKLVSAQLHDAQTASEEAEACLEIWQRTQGYGIEFLDDDGTRLVGETVSKTTVIVIKWPDGTTARHRVIDYANLSILLGQ